MSRREGAKKANAVGTQAQHAANKLSCCYEVVKKRDFPIIYTVVLDIRERGKLEMEIPIDKNKFPVIVIAETCGDYSHYLEF